jgi:DNA-binding CsgD family transcriptional regulator
MPVWITLENGSICYLNDRAEELLGRTYENCLGKPCHSVISARTVSGRKFCGPKCAVKQAALRSHEIEPLPIRIPRRRGESRHVRIVVITAHAPDGSGPRLVHCVVDDEKEERFRAYLTKIMSRSSRRTARSLDDFHLTRRERQILRLLAKDVTLHAISEELALSYATVRNHVQHVLHKLGVHSILEAVAFYLLFED